MSQSSATFKKPKPVSRKAESCCHEENDWVRMGSGHFCTPHASSTTFRCLSASPYAKSDRDSETSGSQQDDEDCGLVMYAPSSSPVCVPYYRYHSFTGNDSPVALRSLPRFLPPIGVFWDIENCQVPKGRSAMAVAQVIRDRFFTGYREAEFLVVCDVKKENSQVIQELNDAQVNLIHVSATCKNAADEKLRQAIRRFADIHGSPASIILISGDINFAADICDLRHRKKIHVILLHKVNTSEALILCASENYNFTHIVESLPPRTQTKNANQPVEIVISNLPDDKDQARVRNRLKQLSDNCGGRVGSIYRNSATIRFPSLETANRARKRMDGEDVFGNKISVGSPTRSLEKKDGSPVKSSNMRKILGRRDDVIKDGKHSNKAIDCPRVVTSNNQNGWQSCPNVRWNAEKEIEDELPERNTGLPCNNTKPNDDIINHLPQPILSTMPPPPPLLWQALPSHWINGNNELQKSAVTDLTVSKVNAEDDGSLCKSAAGKTNDSWLPNKLPDGRRKIRGTHNASKELVEDTCRMGGSESTLLKDSSETESLYTSSTPHQASSCNTKRSRTPSPLTTNGALDIQMQQIISGFPCPPSNSSVKPISNELPARKCRTPSPLTASMGSQDRELWSQSHGSSWASGSSGWQIERRSCSPISLHKSSDIDISERYFHPIQSAHSSSSALSVVNATNPVELQVTNLDQDIDAKDMKRILLSVFREHVMVLHVAVFIQSDGNFAASVKVPSLQDAQYAISQLHRRRVGFKRICISYAHSGGPNPQLIRSQIVSLLLEVPGHHLPLFKFRELFESRYLTSVSVSDLHRMKDVIIVTEDSTGRMVSLNPDHRNTPSPVGSSDGMIPEYPYCVMHSMKPKPEKGWAEQEIDALPNLMVGIKMFSQRIHKLLHSHNGVVPLPSLPNCYHAEFKELEVNEEGVPVEHLVTCVPGVEIHAALSGVKILRWKKNSSSENGQNGDSVKCISPPLVPQLALFSRELVDLLKTAPHCQLPFNRFIPAYHHHFGRQCRVADYGFTKLIDLFEALPHVVQVMGDGGRRVVTLSHRAQIRRFTSDLLRILKSQANKQVAFGAFASAYEKVFGRPFHAPDYGVCFFEDILAEVSENTVVLSTGPSDSPSDIIISVPKREQTPNEIEKTKQFALEVVELLRHAPQCSLMFNKFIPAYHHHFGHQCRVSDYGFTKLIELFEAIPEIVKIEETSEGERRVSLTLRERLKVLAEQMVSLVQSSGWASQQHQKFQKTGNQPDITAFQGSSPPFLPLSAIPSAFLRQNGYALHCEDFECSSLEQLMQCISNTVEVVESPWGRLISLVDQGALHRLELQVRCILLNAPHGRRKLKDFLAHFQWKYPGQICNIDLVKKELSSVIQIVKDNGEEIIELTPIEMFGQELLILLGDTPGGKLTISALETKYLECFGVAVCPARLGFLSLPAAVHAVPKTVIVRGRGHRRSITVNPDLVGAGLQLPLEISKTYLEDKQKGTSSANIEKSSNESSFDVLNGSENSKEKLPLMMTCISHDSEDEEEVSKVNTSDLPQVAKYAPISSHHMLWGNGAWTCSQPFSPLYPPITPHFYHPSMQSYVLPQSSFGWPQIPSPHIQAPLSSSPPSSIPSTPQSFSLSCSLITACPVVPPDPSELPLPLLGFSRNVSRSPPPSEIMTTFNNSETAASGNISSSSVNLSGSENPVRRRMKMKAQFDSPMLLP